jgi:mannitol-1-phosphate/altronate dehydrogenase
LASLPPSTTNNASDVVDAVLGLADIFAPRAAGSAVFRNSLVASLDEIARHGASGAVRRLVQ